MKRNILSILCFVFVFCISCGCMMFFTGCGKTSQPSDNIDQTQPFDPDENNGDQNGGDGNSENTNNGENGNAGDGSTESGNGNIDEGDQEVGEQAYNFKFTIKCVIWFDDDPNHCSISQENRDRVDVNNKDYLACNAVYFNFDWMRDDYDNYVHANLALGGDDKRAGTYQYKLTESSSGGWINYCSYLYYDYWNAVDWSGDRYFSITPYVNSAFKSNAFKENSISFCGFNTSENLMPSANTCSSSTWYGYNGNYTDDENTARNNKSKWLHQTYYVHFKYNYTCIRKENLTVSNSFYAQASGNQVITAPCNGYIADGITYKVQDSSISEKSKQSSDGKCSLTFEEVYSRYNVQDLNLGRALVITYSNLRPIGYTVEVNLGGSSKGVKYENIEFDSSQTETIIDDTGQGKRLIGWKIISGADDSVTHSLGFKNESYQVEESYWDLGSWSWKKKWVTKYYYSSGTSLTLSYQNSSYHTDKTNLELYFKNLRSTPGTVKIEAIWGGSIQYNVEIYNGTTNNEQNQNGNLVYSSNTSDSTITKINKATFDKGFKLYTLECSIPGYYLAGWKMFEGGDTLCEHHLGFSDWINNGIPYYASEKTEKLEYTDYSSYAMPPQELTYSYMLYFKNLRSTYGTVKICALWEPIQYKVVLQAHPDDLDAAGNLSTGLSETLTIKYTDSITLPKASTYTKYEQEGVDEEGKPIYKEVSTTSNTVEKAPESVEDTGLYSITVNNGNFTITTTFARIGYQITGWKYWDSEENGWRYWDSEKNGWKYWDSEENKFTYDNKYVGKLTTTYGATVEIYPIWTELMYKVTGLYKGNELTKVDRYFVSSKNILNNCACEWLTKLNVNDCFGVRYNLYESDEKGNKISDSKLVTSFLGFQKLTLSDLTKKKYSSIDMADLIRAGVIDKYTFGGSFDSSDLSEAEEGGVVNSKAPKKTAAYLIFEREVIWEPVFDTWANSLMFNGVQDYRGLQRYSNTLSLDGEKTISDYTNWIVNGKNKWSDAFLNWIDEGCNSETTYEKSLNCTPMEDFGYKLSGVGKSASVDGLGQIVNGENINPNLPTFQNLIDVYFGKVASNVTDFLKFCETYNNGDVSQENTLKGQFYAYFDLQTYKLYLNAECSNKNTAVNTLTFFDFATVKVLNSTINPAPKDREDNAENAEIYKNNVEYWENNRYIYSEETGKVTKYYVNAYYGATFTFTRKENNLPAKFMSWQAYGEITGDIVATSKFAELQSVSFTNKMKKAKNKERKNYFELKEVSDSAGEGDILSDSNNFTPNQEGRNTLVMAIHYAGILEGNAPTLEKGRYKIKDKNNLWWLCYQVATNAFSSMSDMIFELTCDISVEDFVPIGDETHSFGGIFIGNFHTITLKFASGMESANYVALFGNLNGATISNLYLKGTSEGNDFVGSVAAIATNSSFTRVENLSCSVIGGKTTLTTEDGNVTPAYVGRYVGGLVGKAIGCQFVGCSSRVSGTSQIAGKNEDLGGLIGCVSDYYVTSDGDIIQFEFAGKIDQCYTNYTSLVGFYEFLQMKDTSIITNSYYISNSEATNDSIYQYYTENGKNTTVIEVTETMQATGAWMQLNGVWVLTIFYW